jgi:hypothetical protein
MADQQIAILNERLAKTPPDYITGARELLKAIEITSQRRTKIAEGISSLEASAMVTASYDSLAIFRILADFSGVRPETWELFVLLFLVVVTEFGGIILAGKAHPTKSTDHPIGTIEPAKHVPTPIYRQKPIRTKSEKIEPNEFLEKMLALGSSDRLAGRDTTAKALGIGPYNARRCVEHLVNSGKIRPVGKHYILLESA